MYKHINIYVKFIYTLNLNIYIVSKNYILLIIKIVLLITF